MESSRTTACDRQVARGLLLVLAGLALSMPGCSGSGAVAQQNAEAQQLFDAAMLAADAGQHAQAVQQLTQAIESGGLPIDLLSRGLIQRAASRAETGEIETALAELQAAEDHVPDLAALHQARARVYFLQHDRARAKSEFARAQALDKSLRMPAEYQ